jgi:hypothetical protein
MVIEKVQSKSQMKTVGQPVSPPFSCDEDARYWNVSMSITSMTGLATVSAFWNRRHIVLAL